MHVREKKRGEKAGNIKVERSEWEQRYIEKTGREREANVKDTRKDG